MFIWEEKAKNGFRRNREQRRAMYRKEIEERAGLLLRLGYRARDVKARLHKSVDWDFDLHDAPDHAAEVDRVVDELLKRNQQK